MKVWDPVEANGKHFTIAGFRTDEDGKLILFLHGPVESKEESPDSKG